MTKTNRRTPYHSHRIHQYFIASILMCSISTSQTTVSSCFALLSTTLRIYRYGHLHRCNNCIYRTSPSSSPSTTIISHSSTTSYAAPILNSVDDDGGGKEFHGTLQINNDNIMNDEVDVDMANGSYRRISDKSTSIENDANDDNTLDINIIFDDLPRHIAFICDGNSRWSEQQQQQQQQQDQQSRQSILQLPGLSSSLIPKSMIGHAAGADRVVRLIDTLLSMRQKQHQLNQHSGKKKHNASIQYCTLFAFSTENWSRPYQEVYSLFQVLEQMAIHYSNHDTALREGKVQIRILGDLEDERIPKSTSKELRNLELKSKVACDERRRRRKENDATASDGGLQVVGVDHGDVLDGDVDDDVLTICLAINYGGRADILRAATELALSIINESSSATTSSSSDSAMADAAATVNEREISKRLCTSSLPDVDLIVRTGGERRLSNFFLWEAAYAELYFTDVFWPDFDEQELEKALVWYGKRNRRFGGR